MTDETQALAEALGGEKISLSRVAAAYGAAALALARQATTITTAAAADEAIERVRKHKRTIKALKASLAESVDPLKAVIKHFEGLWKPTIKMYEQAIAIEKQRAADFEALSVPAAEIALAGEVSREQLTEVAAVMAPRAPGSHATTYYSAEVTDPALVPREWLAPDTKRLNAHARAAKERFNIPGVRLVVKRSVTVT